MTATARACTRAARACIEVGARAPRRNHDTIQVRVDKHHSKRFHGAGVLRLVVDRAADVQGGGSCRGCQGKGRCSLQKVIPPATCPSCLSVCAPLCATPSPGPFASVQVKSSAARGSRHREAQEFSWRVKCHAGGEGGAGARLLAADSSPSGCWTPGVWAAGPGGPRGAGDGARATLRGRRGAGWR